MCAKVFIGGLDADCQKEDVEDFLRKAGKLNSVWVARKPPGFAFVEFDDPRDARDACEDLNGREIRGRVVKVELSTGREKRGRAGDDPNCFNCNEPGHMARDCPRRGRSPYRRGRSPSPRRRRSRSRTPDRDRDYGRDRDRRRSRSRSRSRSPRRRSPSPRRRSASPRR